jgi:dihydropyrimidinase
MGLWPQKGGLVLGADADVVILDPERTWRVDEAALHTPAGWSPYHGREVRSSVDTVLVRGRRVFERGEVVGVPGTGRWVRPTEKSPEAA